MARVAAGAIIACALSSACGRAPSTVTFNKDVAPIVFANCVTCHRPGGDGPFSLLTYADAAGHADGDRRGDARTSHASVAAGTW